MQTLRNWMSLGFLPFLVLPTVAPAQEMRIFEHPVAPASIEAPDDWRQQKWPGDPGVLDIRAPDGSVRALLWFTATEMDANRYLNKMLGMKPLEPVGEPMRRTIGGHESWQIVATGSEQGEEEIAETLTVIEADPASTVEGNYVLQVWSPKADAENVAPLVEAIVESLVIDPTRG